MSTPSQPPNERRSEGLGIITFDGATLVTLGGCTLDEQVSLIHGPSAQESGKDWPQISTAARF